jgi:UDP-4-amino-4,6-dideoxy-L-N-acetyl-beta-L-altrosamine transaminase
MPVNVIPYAKQSIKKEDLEAVIESLEGELITRGPLVQLFEETIANYCQVSYAVAFNSGTAALMAAYFAAKVCSSDKLISTPNTFIASIGGAFQAGIHPIFLDIDRKTGNLNLAEAKKFFSTNVFQKRIISIPVHFSGIAVDMKKHKTLLNNVNTLVIEDAAHALGSYYPTGEKVGSCCYSDMTIFSFHPAKTLTTGEGGMVTTKDPFLYHRLCLFRDNGIERNAPYLNGKEKMGYYEVHAITGNYNLTSFQAALGLSQFKRLDYFITQRRKLVACYRHHLQEIPFMSLFDNQSDPYTAFHLFVVQIDFEKYGKTREFVMQELKEKGVGSQVHYIPLYYHPVFYGIKVNMQEQNPEMEIYYQQALSLPLYVDLKEVQVEEICHLLCNILRS